MPVNPPGIYPSDEDNFAAPNYGGTLAHKSGYFTYQTAAGARLFTLPAGARITDHKLEIRTAFDAGSTNPIDLGLGSDADYWFDNAAGGTAAVLRYGDTGSILGRCPTYIEEDTDVTVTYSPTGTPATAGQGYFEITYSMMPS